MQSLDGKPLEGSELDSNLPRTLECGLVRCYGCQQDCAPHAGSQGYMVEHCLGGKAFIRLTALLSVAIESTFFHLLGPRLS